MNTYHSQSYTEQVKKFSMEQSALYLFKNAIEKQILIGKWVNMHRRSYGIFSKFVSFVSLNASMYCKKMYRYIILKYFIYKCAIHTSFLDYCSSGRNARGLPKKGEILLEELYHWFRISTVPWRHVFNDVTVDYMFFCLFTRVPNIHLIHIEMSLVCV